MLVLIVASLNIANSAESIKFTNTNSVIMNDYFYSNSVTRVMERMKKLDSIKELKDQPIYLVLNSGGGSIAAGLELINFSKGLTREVITVSHFSASMAFETVQHLGKRLVFYGGILMSHKARGYAYGEFPGQLDNRLQLSKDTVTLLNKQAISRTNGKHTLESYRKLIENEYWCLDSNCSAEGFIDDVAIGSCDGSLKGTYDTKETFFFRGAKVDLVFTYSKCPLQTYPIGFKAFVNGNEVYTEDNTGYGIDDSLIQKINKKIEFRLNYTKNIRSGFTFNKFLEL